MNKYNQLWKWIQENGEDRLELSFAEIERIAGIPLDHSFLKYKKELQEYGYQVGKIAMKAETVVFKRIER